MNRKKKILFSLIGISLPFIALLFIEVLLYFLNVANEEKIFISDPNNSLYYIVNPKLGQRFIDNPGIKPPLSFISKTKAANEVRIIAMGASTTVGFPYGYEVAFPKILENKLQCQFPNKSINIINIGLTAINTYTVLEMTDEAIEINPDFVLLYSGQNEFYGKYGIASTQSGGLPPFIVRLYINLKKLRIARLIKKVLRPTIKMGDKSETLMAKMVGNKSIEFNSISYKNALKQYSYNIDKIINKLREKDIPLLIGTLVSNQKGQPPFSSAAISDEVRKEIKFGDDLSKQGKIENALKSYSLILKNNTSHADLNFKIANCYFELGKYDSAKIFYKKASQYDLIRFRAPQEYNDIIKSKSTLSKVTVVDIKKEFENNSPNSIIGSELLLEHVHPTIKGYELMAQSFFNSIVNSELIIQQPTIKNNCDLFFVSKVDSIYGSLLVTRLKQNWPFINTTDIYNEINFTPTNEIDNIAYDRYLRKIGWPEATNKLYNYYLSAGKFEKAYETASILSNEYPILDAPILLMVKPLLILKKYRKAERLLEVSTKKISSDKLNKDYFHVLLINEEINKSILFLEQSYFNKDKEILLNNLKLLHSAKNSYSIDLISRDKALRLAKMYANFGLTENVTKYNIIADSLLILYE